MDDLAEKLGAPPYAPQALHKLVLDARDVLARIEASGIVDEQVVTQTIEMLEAIASITAGFYDQAKLIKSLDTTSECALDLDSIPNLLSRLKELLFSQWQSATKEQTYSDCCKLCHYCQWAIDRVAIGTEGRVSVSCVWSLPFVLTCPAVRTVWPDEVNDGQLHCFLFCGVASFNASSSTQWDFGKRTDCHFCSVIQDCLMRNSTCLSEVFDTSKRVYIWIDHQYTRYRTLELDSSLNLPRNALRRAVISVSQQIYYSLQAWAFIIESKHGQLNRLPLCILSILTSA
jgi:hypothetical protein